MAKTAKNPNLPEIVFTYRSLLEDKQRGGEQLESSCREHGLPMDARLRVCHFAIGENCSAEVRSVGFASGSFGLIWKIICIWTP